MLDRVWNTGITKTVLFHGMKRSGNHAVINWLRSVEAIPFHNDKLAFRRFGGCGDYSYRRLLAKVIWREMRSGQFMPSRRLIGFEDVHLDQPIFANLPESVVNIVLVRSAENVFASRIRKGSVRQGPYALTSSNLERSVATWVAHAREMLGQTSVLNNKIGIYFDTLIADSQYRAMIAHKVGGTFDDAALQVQAKEGGGSSFKLTSAGVRERAVLLSDSERDILDRILSSEPVRDLQEQLSDHHDAAAVI